MRSIFAIATAALLANPISALAVPAPATALPAGGREYWAIEGFSRSCGDPKFESYCTFVFTIAKPGVNSQTVSLTTQGPKADQKSTDFKRFGEYTVALGFSYTIDGQNQYTVVIEKDDKEVIAPYLESKFGWHGEPLADKWWPVGKRQ